MKAENSKKAQSILTHPLVLGAFFVYVINNHVLQIYSPSWLTGKLSGFAWLFFAPYTILFLATLLLPRKINVSSKFQAAIFMLAGIIFALIKTNTTLNQVFVNTLKKIIQTPVQIIVDPSDLLALIALIGSFYFWKSYFPAKTNLAFSRNLLFIGLFSFFTLADAAAGDYGITYIETYEGILYAHSDYVDYRSNDGGFTWEEAEENIELPIYDSDQWAYSKDKLIQARFDYSKKIEITTDGGKTWSIEYTLEPVTEAQKAYYVQNRKGNPFFEQGPFDVEIQETTNNAIFAMGQEGVLIRQPNAKWTWVRVGTYQRIAPSSLGLLVSILWGEGLLGLASGMLIFSTISLKLFRQKKIWWLMVMLGWAGIAISLSINQPALSGGGYDLTYAIIVVTAGLIIPFGLGIRYFGLALLNDQLFKFGIYAGLALVFFITPYVLWIMNIIHQYETATLFAISIQVILLTIGTIATSPLSKTKSINE